MIHIKIDNTEIEVKEGTTVLNAARQAGIDIPTLCDHPALEPYGGCRLCLVEIEGARTLQPACTLPANNNMVVHTDTEKVKSARKFVLSMIFSERNHFCPYCQVSGGDCELQNAAYDEDMTHWPLQPNWRPYEVDASHPYFVLDHNRCILCRRCVRACGELVGNFTLGMEERGAKTILVADLGVPLGSSSCISCGTCVQICPTGALIDRWSAYRGKETEVEKTKTVCIGCSVGCGIEVLTRNNNLVRIEGDWDAEVNAGVLCEIGRFQPMDDQRERVVTPLVRKNGSLKAATWEETLDIVQSKFANHSGKASDIAAIASTRLPAESLYAFKQIFSEKLGSNIVTSTEEGRYTAPLSELINSSKNFLEGNFNDLEHADMVITLGADLTKEHQVAGFMIKRAIPEGLKLITISYDANGMDAFTPYATKINKGSELEFIQALAAVEDDKNFGAYLKKTGLSIDEIKKLSAVVLSSKKPVIIYGTDFESKEKQNVIEALVSFAEKIDAKMLSMKGNANSMAAAQYALEQPFQINGEKVVFAAIGDEEPSQMLIKKLENAEFLIVQATYHSALTAKADVVLPVTGWLEQEGHYISLDGRLQKASKSLQSPVDVKSNLEVFEKIAEKLEFSLDSEWKSALSEKSAVIAIG